MKKSTTNNYERPEVQVVYVETESAMATGSPVTATGGQIYDVDETDYGTF